MEYSKIAFTDVGLGLTTHNIVVTKINLKPDNSGDWTIGINVAITCPNRNVANDATISIVERHMLAADITVKLSEILAATNAINVDVLTVAQLQTAITQIAIAKAAVALGITLNNVVIS